MALLPISNNISDMRKKRRKKGAKLNVKPHVIIKSYIIEKAFSNVHCSGL